MLPAAVPAGGPRETPGYTGRCARRRRAARRRLRISTPARAAAAGSRPAWTPARRSRWPLRPTPTMPPAKITIRAVPRSRIVARRALYSSCSRTVMVLAPPADTPACGHARPGCALWHRIWERRSYGLSRNGHFDSSVTIIPLSFYELSATLLASPLLNSRSGNAQVNRKTVVLRRPLLWSSARLVLGATSSEAATKAKTRSAKSAKVAATKRATVVLGRALADPQGEAGHRARPRDGPRDGRHGAAALQGRRERRPGARCARRRRHHLRPRHQRDALGRELADPALDRQHHQGDDRDRVPREQPRPHRSRSPSPAATCSRPRRRTCTRTTR